ncbi:MAG: YcjX family protein [Paracoccaceae bacterium]
MGLGAISDAVLSRLEEAAADTRAAFEPVVRLGVTGLARSGKTVFITSLVANLLDRGRMLGFTPEAEGRIMAAYLQPQPDATVPRFDYEGNLAALTATTPHWPESTRAVSQLRLSLRLRRGGLLRSMRGARTVHIDIIDYPGEWLLDLALLDQTYAEWSQAALARAAKPSRAGLAASWLGALQSCDARAALNEPTAQSLAAAFTAYLQSARDAGLSPGAPGRFLLPGDLAGSPVLTFAPLPLPESRARNTSLYKAFERRYEAYRSAIVKPFFRQHFARLDRQVVLLDVLGALHSGPAAMQEMRDDIANVLTAFRPGADSWLGSLLRRRIDRILFAATKADHLHHTSHDDLAGLTTALVREARDRAAFAGAQTKGVALAALRATVEQTLTHEGEALHCVRGVLAGEKGAGPREAALYPGAFPADPDAVLNAARKAEPQWLGGAFELMRFLPQAGARQKGAGLAHIRMDQAAEFLLADKL